MKTVLLLANYELDQQYSMLQFADLVAEGLGKAGVPYVRLQPKAYLGSLGKGFPKLRKYLGYVDKYLIFPYVLRRFLKAWSREGLLVHILDHSNALYYPFCKGFRTVLSCHDLIAIKAAKGLTYFHKVGFMGKILQKSIEFCLKQVTIIVCLSKATQRAVRQVLDKTKEDLPIVYLGSYYPYAPMDREQVEKQIDALWPGRCPEEKYCLHVGNDAWYKNREGLLHLYGALKRLLGPRAPILVLVGPKLSPKEVALADKYCLEVVHFQNLQEEQIQALYAAAECLILPSIEEGLGLPILEAMAVGCPVLCTQMEPFSEIAGQAAVYIPRLEDLSTAGKNAWAKESSRILKALLEAPISQKEKRRHIGFQQAAIFSRQRAMEGYLEVYERSFRLWSSK